MTGPQLRANGGRSKVRASAITAPGLSFTLDHSRGCSRSVRRDAVPILPPAEPVTEALALLLGSVAVVATGLSLLRSKVWWIRIWDFPRVQVATVGIAGLALWIRSASWDEGWSAVFTAALTLATAYQIGMVWRYTRLAPREVQRAKHPAPDRCLSLVVSN